MNAFPDKHFAILDRTARASNSPILTVWLCSRQFNPGAQAAKSASDAILTAGSYLIHTLRSDTDSPLGRFLAIEALSP